MLNKIIDLDRILQSVPDIQTPWQSFKKKNHSFINKKKKLLQSKNC